MYLPPVKVSDEGAHRFGTDVLIEYFLSSGARGYAYAWQLTQLSKPQ